MPDIPACENHEFVIRLKNSGKELVVPIDKSAAEILNENDMQVNIKCSDGLCGVCKCRLIAGAVEHRDFVLSRSERENHIILCQSRAALEGGVITIDL